MTDQLNAKNLSWRYYTPTPNSIWTGPNAIEHICGPNAPPPNGTACVGSDWVNHVVIYNAQKPAPILTDIANNQLPAVSWVIPAGKNSDHAGNPITVGGPSWVASIVNAVGNSSYWANTAIVVTWDDWGGWYDHVPPPQVINDGESWGSGYVYGFRVPLVVISPYAGPAISLMLTTLGEYSSACRGELWSDSRRLCRRVCRRPFRLFQLQPNTARFSYHQRSSECDDFLNDKTPSDDPDDD